mgnify:CR=1 FL=1
MKKLLLMVVALLALGSAVGCAYGAATFDSKNNKLYVIKNDGLLGGILRGVLECSPSGDSWNCVETPDKP